MQITKTEAGLFEAEIDGQVYEFQKWGAEEALNTLFDLSMLMGRPLGAMLAQGGAAELTAPTIETILASLADNLRTNRSTVMALCKRLATAKLFCDGKEIGKFDLHYKDRLPVLFQVVAANLTVQYQNFFHALPNLLPIGKPAPAAVSG